MPLGIYNLTVVILRGGHAAVCEGADIQLLGASGIIGVSFLCHRRSLPSGYSTRWPHRVAARRLHPPQQLLHQWGEQGFQGFSAQLQPFQGFPHLHHPLSSCWRSSDQSWMWVRFDFAVHLSSSGLMLCIILGAQETDCRGGGFNWSFNKSWIQTVILTKGPGKLRQWCLVTVHHGNSNWKRGWLLTWNLKLVFKQIKTGSWEQPQTFCCCFLWTTYCFIVSDEPSLFSCNNAL